MPPEIKATKVMIRTTRPLLSLRVIDVFDGGISTKIRIMLQYR